MKMLSASSLSVLLAGAALTAAASPDQPAASAAIDALVEKNYALHGVTPNEPAPDWVLVRRLHLDIAGRIPTRAETEAYLESSDPGKASKLIGELLGSEGYVNHWFNFWADLLPR
jgi:hypothetical protein